MNANWCDDLSQLEWFPDIVDLLLSYDASYHLNKDGTNLLWQILMHRRINIRLAKYLIRPLVGAGITPIPTLPETVHEQNLKLYEEILEAHASLQINVQGDTSILKIKFESIVFYYQWINKHEF